MSNQFIVLRRLSLALWASAVGVALAMGSVGLTHAQDFVPMSAGASVKIVEPANGAAVKSPFKVVFQVTGMQIKPAGPPEPGTGHHHLLIDLDGVFGGQVIPSDATHLHFGKGQTEAMVDLPPGVHVLTLQFADGLHRSYGSLGSHKIQVTVQGK
jgi:hypothetical protein